MRTARAPFSPTRAVSTVVARQPAGGAGTRSGNAMDPASTRNWAGASTLGPDAGSALGPPGANEQLRVNPANSRTMATSTATAPTMSRTESAERGGFPVGPGSAGPGGEALLTPPIVPA